MIRQADPPPLPRWEALVTDRAAHGAPNVAELEQLGLTPDDILDFSVNSNAYGPSPAVADAIRRVPLDRYPDPEALMLRRALAHHHGVSPDRIIVGNGTAELIHLMALAFVRFGDSVGILAPTFGEYERAVRLLGARVVECTATEDNGFTVDEDAVGLMIQHVQPRLFFLCRPNNPTGGVVSLDALRAWAAASPCTLIVVDEAYINFAPEIPSALDLEQPNILVLRSMTKDYALAGLRLGYAIAAAPVIEALARVRPEWNVNALAQAAGLAALADQAHLWRTIALLRAAHQDLVQHLMTLGLLAVPSAVHFSLVKVGNGRLLRQRLLIRKIQVRDCASFSLPAYVRIATRRPEENTRLLDALHEILT